MKRQVGLKVQVPEWANWIAQDKSGTWWVYKEKPYLTVLFGKEHIDAWWSKAQNEIIGKTLNKNKWRKSLKRIK
ncbi:MAG TPA: hypothetical protein HPP64_09150 [Gammaproteobacteria bacterium]|jgi:hypothetical protein|nr:hypothetical protein [Gammaproteobacteria bacterium]